MSKDPSTAIPDVEKSREQILQELSALRTRLAAGESKRKAPSRKLSRQRAADLPQRGRCSQSLYDSLQEGFALCEIVLDDSGQPATYRFLEVNEAFCRLTGLAREALLGRTVGETVPGAQPVGLNEFSRVALQGQALHCEQYSPVMKKWFEVHASSPETGKFTVLVLDISERKRVEQTLQESRDDLARAQAVSHTGSWRFKVESTDLTWSEETYRIFELPIGTPMTYAAFLDTVHPEDRPAVERAWENALRGEISYDIEHRIVVGGGTKKWVHERAELEFDPQGVLLGGFGTVQDISERKRAEDALYRYELLSEHSRDIILFIRRSDGRILEANAAALNAYGYSREELLARTIHDLRAPDTRSLTAEQMVEADAQGILFETVHRCRDGSLFPVEVSSRGATIDGERTLISIIRDITARTSTEQALQESEYHLARAQQIAHLGSWSWDVAADRLYWSEETFRLFGLQPGEVVPSHREFMGYIHPADRDRVERCIQEALAHGRYATEFRIIQKAGEERYLASEGHVSYDEHGNPAKVEGSVQDITEHKRSEEALRASEARYRTLFDSMDEGYCIIEVLFSPDGKPVDCRFLEVNPAFERQTGLKDAVGKRMRELAPDHEQHWFDIYGRIALTGIPERFENAAQALGHYYDVYAFRLGGAESRKVAILFNDISERKRSEKALRQLNETLEQKVEERTAEIQALNQALVRKSRDLDAFFQQTPSPLVLLDRDFTFIRVNEAYARACRKKVEDFPGHNHFEFYPSEARAIFEEVVQTRQPYQAFARPFSDPDHPEWGETYWDWQLTPLLDGRGEVELLVLSLEDVTARKKAEASAEAQQRVYRRIGDLVPFGIWTCTLDGGAEYLSQSFLEMVGMSLEDCKRFGWTDRLPPEDVERTIRDWKRCIAQEDPWDYEHHIRDKAGTYRVILSRGIPLEDERGKVTGWGGINLDITERRQAEEALCSLNAALKQRAVQLQALALQLTEAEERERRRISDLLHDDLQQMLAASRFNLSVVLPAVQGHPTAEPTLRQVDEILSDSIEKSRRLSHDLSPVILHHAGLSTATVEWLVRRKKERYGLSVEADTRRWRRLDYEALSVFLFRSIQELLFNVAKHAGVAQAHLRLVHLEDRVEVLVTDRGVGFDPHRVEEVDQQSQGFGLFSIRERAEYLGGSLKIESAPGEGSSITLTIPLQRLDAPRKPIPLPPFQESRSSTARLEAGQDARYRVLLVDDHQVLRQGLIAVLDSQSDIQVIGEASNGREAVDLARSLNPDVILMDIVMPEMDGIEATRIIKAELPQVRVIGLSMLSDEDVSEQLMKAGAEGFINKGKAAEELVEAIRQDKSEEEDLRRS